MRVFTLAVAVCFVACDLPEMDGVGGVKSSIRNEYAVSLFSLVVTVDKGTPVKVFDRERIEMFDTATSTIRVPASDGQKVRFELSAVSVGDTQGFGPIEVVKGSHDEYHFEYDYDLATAKFTIHHGWQ